LPHFKNADRYIAEKIRPICPIGPISACVSVGLPHHSPQGDGGAPAVASAKIHRFFRVFVKNRGRFRFSARIKDKKKRADFLASPRAAKHGRAVFGFAFPGWR